MAIAILHVTDDHLESYALGRLGQTDADTLEEHLLICDICQVRLDENDSYVLAMRSALRKNAEREENVWAGISARLFPRAIFTPAFAGIAAAMVLALGVATQVARMPHAPAAPAETVTVRLEAMKGDAPSAVANRPLDLLLDGRGLPPAASYRLQVVNHEGRTVWESPAVVSQETLRGSVVKPLGPGSYFVRVFGTGAEPLREFALQVK